MGWARGSELAEELFRELKRYVPKAKQQHVAQLLVDKFEDHDADDWDMSKGSLYLTAYPDGKPGDDLDDDYDFDDYDDEDDELDRELIDFSDDED